MANSDNALDILIRFLVERKGADEAEKAIQDQIDATKQAGGDISDLERAQQKLAQSTKDVAKETEGSTISHHELHQAVRALRLEYPELAHAAHFALEPMSAAVAGLIGAFALWENRVKTLTQALGGVELPDLDPDFAGKIQKQADAYNALADAVKNADTAFDSVEKSADRASKSIEKHAQQQKDLLKGERGLELAKLESSDMSDAQKAAARAAIDKRYRDAGLKIDEKESQDLLGEKAAKAFGLDQEAKDKAAQANAIHVRSDKADAGFDSAYQKNSEAAKAANAESEKRIKMIEGLQDARGLRGFITGIPDLLKYASTYGPFTPGVTAIGLEREGQARNQIVIDQYDAFQEQKAARDKLRKKQEDLTTEGAKEAGDAEAIRKELPGDQADAKQDQAVKRRLADLDTATDREKAVKDIERDIPGAAEAQAALTAGGQVDQKHAQVLAGLKTLLESVGYSQGEIVQLLDDSQHQMDSFKNDLAQLRRRVGSAAQHNTNSDF